MSSQVGSLRTNLEGEKRIFDDNGFDVTPRPLTFSVQRTRNASVRSKPEESDIGSGSRLEAAKKLSKDGPQVLRRVTVVTRPPDKDYLKELEIVKKTLRTSKLDMEKTTVKPATVELYLEESAYQWHLYIPSTNYVQDDTMDKDQQESVEPRRRYRLSTAAQTFNPVSKKKVTQTAPIEMSTSCVFASEWDLYDTYRRLSYEDEDAELEAEQLEMEILGAEAAAREARDTQRTSITSESTLSQSNEIHPVIASRKAIIQAQKVMRMPEFQYAASVAERLLASNTFLNQQISFMAAIRDPQETSTGFRYIMNELWSFSCVESRNRIVNAISWNTINMNIVAVGYGYVQNSEGDEDGLVCCWSVKNPSQPERVFLMKSPVTTLSFSHSQPNLLALGCYNGSVIVLNISSKTGDKLVVNGEEGSLRYGPVGNLQWFFHTDFVVETEEIISVGKNGRVYKWNYVESYRSYEIMKLRYFQPNLKAKTQRTVNRYKSTVKYLSGLAVSLHPKDRMIYYVSTLEGCVVKCAMNRHDHIEDVFPAHAGPVYGILHSPFCANIFCTYSSDWYICLWAHDLKVPLLKLYYTKQPVLGVCWSPIHSTILATISGPYLSLWDLARKAIVPISTVKSSTCNLFTSIKFSTTGMNILAGDVAGDVFVFNLADMPYPPFLQEEALIRALQKALVGNPQHCSYLEAFIRSRVHPSDTSCPV